MAKDHVQFQSFVGVDLHKCTVSLAAGDGAGEPMARLKTSTKNVQRIDTFLDALPKPVHLAVETVGFVEWFIDRFGSRVARFDLAHATELANRRGKRRKTDRHDAPDIAVRLARGDCPIAWIADEPTVRLRKLGRHWRTLSRTLSRIKHGVRGMLDAANLKGPTLNGAAMHKWLLAHGTLLKDAQRRNFADLLDVILLLERIRQRLRVEIVFVNREPRFASMMDILKSTPGIDEIWALIIAAEVGDFARFPNADALEVYAGLNPDNLESAGRTQPGSITKAGSAALRWALGHAALTLCRSDARQEAIRQRLIKRRGKPIANVAMARRLLRTLYAMMRDGTTYQRGPATAHTDKANAACARRRTTRQGAAA